MTGRIELVHNFTGVTDYVVIQWYKTTSPLTPASGLVNGATVTKVVYPAPHGQESLLIEQLDPVMYLVKAFSSSDGTTLDEQINELACDASIAARYAINRITYVVDRGETGDPSDGDSGLRDSRLLDVDYVVNERGTGPMVPPDETGAEYIDRSDDGGGFDWIDPDKKFISGAIYDVFINEKIDVMPDTGGGGSDYNDVVVLTSNTTYDIATHSGKVLISGGSGAVRILTVGALSGVGDSKFILTNQSVNQNYLTLKLNAGDTVAFQGENKNAIHLEKGSSITVLIKDNVMYVYGYTGRYQMRGDIEFSTGLRSSGPFLLANGSLGELSRDNYPGLWEYIASLPSGAVVPLASWNIGNNIRKFAWDETSGIFRIPNYANMVKKSLASLAESSGNYESDRVGGHDHQLRTGRGGGIDNNTSGGAVLYGSNGTVLWPGSNGSNISVQNNLPSEPDAETRVKTVRQYPLLCL